MSYEIYFIIILFLIALNGIFSMSEFALVSAKNSRLKQLALEGNNGAVAALELTKKITPFLSTIQVGITLVGIISGAFGGATLAEGLVSYINRISSLAPYSYGISFSIVVIVITYLTLIFGELVPKQIALSNPEKIASWIAKPMLLLSNLTRPLVYVLSISTESVLQLMKIEKTKEPSITEEEIKIMIKEGTMDGIFEKEELDMIEGVLQIGDLHVESLMTHRTDIVAIDLDDDDSTNLKKIISSGRSYFPAFIEDMDNVQGMVSVKHLMTKIVESGKVDIKKTLIKPLFVPEAISVLKLLEFFKKEEVHIALITDEYGGIQGIITLHDILEAIVGDVRSLGEPVQNAVVIREDGSCLLDADTPIEKTKEILSVDFFPEEEKNYYRTIAGFIMFLLQSIPKTGDYVDYKGLRYEVVDIDGNRIDKVLVTKLEEKIEENLDEIEIDS